MATQMGRFGRVAYRVGLWTFIALGLGAMVWRGCNGQRTGLVPPLWYYRADPVAAAEATPTEPAHWTVTGWRDDAGFFDGPVFARIYDSVRTDIDADGPDIVVEQVDPTAPGRRMYWRVMRSGHGRAVRMAIVGAPDVAVNAPPKSHEWPVRQVYLLDKTPPGLRAFLGLPETSKLKRIGLVE